MECSEPDTCASAATLSLCMRKYTHTHTHFFSIRFLSPTSSTSSLPFSSSPLPHLSLKEATPSHTELPGLFAY